MHLDQLPGPLLVRHALLQLDNKVVWQVYPLSLHLERTIWHPLLHLQLLVELQCLEMRGIEVHGINHLVVYSNEVFE